MIALTFSDVVGPTSGLLQLAVACYALRLSFRFGTARVGWLVFGAFSLLALVHLFLALNPFGLILEPELLAGIAYGVVSVLLLVSIARLETSLEKRWQSESESLRNQSAWESEIESQVAELSKANSALVRSDARLQAEISEHKRLLEEKESTCQTLLTAARQTETDLLQTVATLKAKIAAHHQQQSTLVEAARQQGMAAVAGRLRERLGTLRLTALDEAKSRSARLVRAAKLAQKRHHPAKVSCLDSRGSRLAVPLAQLAAQLAGNGSAVLQQIESITRELEQFGATPADDVSTACDAAPKEDPGSTKAADFREHLIDNLTETGTDGNQPQLETPEPVEVENNVRSEREPAV